MLSPALQKYVDFVAAAGRPVCFTEIVALTPGYNGFRFLKQRGLVENVVPSYRGDAPYTGPRPPKYVLTQLGWKETTVSSEKPGDPVRPGFYRHWKGNIYQVDRIARHHETGERLVIYRGVAEWTWYARPEAEWFDEMEGGVPRFVFDDTLN